ncbi:hypothetical protein C8Q80DRAFT_1276657 [Daedaleopsis nitida]|nr:hypothetical protein C8Q80DRAFT_1276657 [Daedaleopsis nitida]
MDECDTIPRCLVTKICDMGHDSICALPVELVLDISSLVRRADLPAFLLANRIINMVGTPRLYSKIELYDLAAVHACLNTLKTFPQNTSFGRDLAQFVRILLIHTDCMFLPSDIRRHPQPFEPLLAEIAPRLVNLQRLRTGEQAQLAENNVLDVLGTTPYSQLEILELELGSSSDFPDHFNEIEVDSSSDPPESNTPLPSPCLPKLNSLRIRAPGPLSGRQVCVLHDVLGAASAQLHSLALSVSASSGFLTFLLCFTQFPSLKHLEVQWRSIPHITTSMGNIRSLLVEFSPADHDLEPLSSAFFPALEEIACAHYNISAFLSPATDGYRSIHTVALDHASYERNGGRFLELIPPWADVADTLKCLKYSAVPIRHLRFCVTRVNAQSLASVLSELKELESLLMILDSQPSRDTLAEWGTTVLPQVPRLHTLLISDAVLKYDYWDSRFWFARDVELQRTLLDGYVRYAPALRLVAFTTEFEWERGVDGEWRMTEDVEAEVGTDLMEKDVDSDESEGSDEAFGDEETDSDESGESTEDEQADEDDAIGG